MSQKPAPARPVPPPTRVSNGVPWWLWLVIGGFGIFVIVTLVRKAIPDDPNLIVQEGLDALSKGDVVVVERSVEKLKQFPDHAADMKLIEGMMYIGKSKPLLAVPLLQEAAKEPKLRLQALTQLGSALTRSRQRMKAIEVFETVLKEDESADDARLNLAYLFKDMISWEIAIQHLEVLKQHGHQLGAVHLMFADIYFDMGRYSDAATEYKAAIDADPTNPANSQRASRLLTSKMETGDMGDIEEFLALVDSEGVRDSAQALALAQNGETEKALSTLEHALHEMANDRTVNITNAQILAGLDSKERAIEGLESLRQLAGYMTRNLKLYESLAKLSATAEKTELAVTFQENADQIRDLESQFAAKLSEVIKTRDNAQLRIEVGDLAAAAGHPEAARAMYLGASFIDMSMESTVQEKINLLYEPLPLLVPLAEMYSVGSTEPPGSAPDADPSSDAAPKEEAKEEAKEEVKEEVKEEAKEEAPPEPAPN